MNYKLKQKLRAKEHFEDFISEQPYDWVMDNWKDLHHHAYNTDYYIIGECDWCGDEIPIDKDVTRGEFVLCQTCNDRR